MEITFLGTGAGMPSKERNVSALVLNLLHEINELWLFDCGEATQHQILKTTLKPRKITKIFITHLHGDHIFGLPGLLSSRSFLDGDERVTIYGPKGIKQFVETSLHISKTHLTYPLEFVELEEEGIVFENERFIIHNKILDHNILSFGYRVTEKDQLGELLVDKLIALGVKPGPIYKTIKENEQTTLEDGTVINRKDVLGPPKKGKVISIFGDTRYKQAYASFIQGSDLLVHEATFDRTKRDLARQYYHTTAYDAAKLAKEAKVKQLILTHISSRYQYDGVKQLLKEAQSIFKSTKIANDLYTFSLK
ncbi:MAG TPA: ribonuclease Z [Pseudogracilibacillus sp.]|nr:ribonuclease Z [Pseudogracilibacillus sp.]